MIDELADLLTELSRVDLGELNTLVRWLITLLLSGIVIYLIFLVARRLRLSSIARMLLFATVLVLMAFTIRYAWIATYIHGDIAHDMLVYTQTTPDVTMVMEEIEHLSERLAGGKEMSVAFDEFTSWPFWWYLRDYPNKVFFGKEPVGPLDAPAVLVGLDNESAVRPYLTDHVRRQYRLRIQAVVSRRTPRLLSRCSNRSFQPATAFPP